MTRLHRPLAVLVALVGAATLVPGVAAAAATCTPGPSAQCQGADLSGANLVGRDLRGINLHGAKLTGADLTGATLAGATLSGANFTGATLNRASLAGVQATGARFASVLMQHANLTSANLWKTNLDGSQLDHSDLTGADLKNVQAHGTNFAMAIMDRADFGSANLAGSNFFGVRAHHAKFISADLTSASFRGASFGSTDFSAAQIHKVDLTGSNVNDDHMARRALFLRVFTHVNAYGSTSKTCNRSGSGANDAVSCSGANDDPNATWILGGDVSFHWGSQRSNGLRSFGVKGHRYGESAELLGEADMGLSAFHVHHVIGGVEQAELGKTGTWAGRGDAGGPLALGIGHHHHFFPGYHMTMLGWIQRYSRASTA